MSIRLVLSLFLGLMMGAGCTSLPIPALQSQATTIAPTATESPTATPTVRAAEPTATATATNMAQANVAVTSNITPTATISATEAVQTGLLLVPTATPTITIMAQTTITAASNITPTATISATEPVQTGLLLVPTATPLTESTPDSTPVTTTLALSLPITATATPALILFPTATPTPMEGALTSPSALALNGLNVRSGPGTDYPIITGLAAGEAAAINGQNTGGDWWQVALANGSTGWVYAPLVEVQGSTANVAVVEAVPPPPTPTATPLAEPQPVTITEPAPTAAEPPPTTAEQPGDPSPTAPPASDGPEFRVIQKRLWDVYENGGSLFGDSVSCGEKRQLEVIVVDPNGVRINGVAVQAQYGAREIFVTGSQGKGDGAVEFVLGSGQDVTVIRDVDGRPVTSEMATGLVTRPDAIPYEQLIAAKYCTDDASCAHFVAAPGCLGHFSWTVIFQRQY